VRVFAMLNRTNRTLSANLNRLNLGTRSLASLASVNTGAQALRTRPAFAVAMRDGTMGILDEPISIGKRVIPQVPSSPSVSVEAPVALLTPLRATVAAAVPPAASRPAFTALPTDRDGSYSDPSRPRYRPSRECGRHHRKPFVGKPWQHEGGGCGGLGIRQQRIVVRSVVATVAAASA